MLNDLKQPGKRSLLAGKYGRDSAVSLRPWEGKLERGQMTGVHNANLLPATLTTARPATLIGALRCRTGIR